MKKKRDEFILYGLDKHKEIIDKIICDLNIYDHDFDIRLILTEALTNAFAHGNKNDEKKPVFLRYDYDGQYIKFEIEDSGTGYKNVRITDDISDDRLLEDSGRGLFLIKCISDEMDFKDNTLIIKKYLKD